MSDSLRTIAGVASLLFALSSPAYTQGAPQALAAMRIDEQALARGYRATRVVGSNVINESDEVIGTVDDMIVTKDDKVPFVILSVGGFLGMGSKYVVVPANTLTVVDEKIVLRGATRESLKSLPAYIYAR